MELVIHINGLLMLDIYYITCDLLMILSCSGEVETETEKLKQVMQVGKSK